PGQLAEVRSATGRDQRLAVELTAHGGRERDVEAQIGRERLLIEPREYVAIPERRGRGRIGKRGHVERCVPRAFVAGAVFEAEVGGRLVDEERTHVVVPGVLF